MDYLMSFEKDDKTDAGYIKCEYAIDDVYWHYCSTCSRVAVPVRYCKELCEFKYKEDCIQCAKDAEEEGEY